MNSSRSLLRSHQLRGLRVRRSSSRIRPSYSGGGVGPWSWSGQASPGCSSPLMSTLLYGPRLDDLIDQLLVVPVAVRLAPHGEEVELGHGGIDQTDLVHLDHLVSGVDAGRALQGDLIEEL